MNTTRPTSKTKRNLNARSSSCITGRPRLGKMEPGGGSKYSHRDSNKLVKIGDELVYFGWGDFLTSDKGYEWKKQEETLNVEECFPLKDLSLFTRNSSSTIYVSQDAKLFKELILEEGIWRYLSVNEKAILGVYYANKHEETVLRVGRYICQAKI
ncbi:hypothetical protein [Methylomonas koyamae]|uniref:hypothetical protein n=1 Tax=Methylomonas koyamae TaxID=702114 RepID=UPI001C81DE72|nr:hypothetical protein [Methylomonas koyamae]